MSEELRLKYWVMFRSSPGSPPAVGTWACQKEGAKPVCKNCILSKPGFEVLGVTAVAVNEKADPGSEVAGQKTWSTIPVCCHVKERIDIDRDQAPDAIKMHFPY